MLFGEKIVLFAILCLNRIDNFLSVCDFVLGKINGTIKTWVGELEKTEKSSHQGRVDAKIMSIRLSIDFIFPWSKVLLTFLDP